MSIITALFALGIALASIGGAVIFLCAISMITAFNVEEVAKSKRLFIVSATVVLVGAFIIGLTAQGATA